MDLDDDTAARLEQTLKARAVNGRIPCGEALLVAEELGVSPGEVGRTLNRLGIKVQRCQLGCF